MLELLRGGPVMVALALLLVPFSPEPALAQGGGELDLKLEAKLDNQLAKTIKKAGTKGQQFGVAGAIVTDNMDPDMLGRVKVRFPWLDSDSAVDDTYWARLVVPMTGSGRGSWYLPEVGDEVLVAFEHGDIRRPIVIGGFWNGSNQPPGCSKEDGACSCARETCDAPPEE